MLNEGHKSIIFNRAQFLKIYALLRDSALNKGLGNLAVF